MTDFGRATLDDRYLIAGEASPQDGFLRAAKAWSDDEAHAARLYDYASKMWFMFATPVLSNAPVRTSWGATFQENFLAERFKGKFRGMPISCFLNMPGDSREGLTDHYAENAWLSSVGGGIGGYWGGIRSNGAKTSSGSSSSGVIPFLKVVDSLVMAFSQGETRRGSYAAYLDIDHPEIVEFLEMRKPTGGDVNRKCLNLHNGVNIPDRFMEIIERCTIDAAADDSWDLIDPNSKRVVDTVSARELWQRLLDMRMQTGEPYIHFIDATNRALPEAQKKLGLRVNQSNLCSEITLATSEERTAVCCLSSVNLEKFDEWAGNTQFIEDLIRMLDNVIEFFVLHAPDALHRAKFSAMRERSVGLGQMGFHSYLQKHLLPFESVLAVSANRRMSSFIKKSADAATRVLATERGECPDGVGTGVRNMHLLAIAPNASSSIICGGTSPSIEPIRANAYTHKTGSGSWLVRNQYLAARLEEYGMDTDDVWQSIVVNKGSVQHLDFLSQEEKDVFKTAMELDQRWVVDHASHRQGFLCQAQSLNVFFPADAQISYLHLVHFQAWKQGLKTMYYLRSESIKRADNLSVKISREDLASVVEGSVCLSCEG
jgi:ribonucleoside-diphosphate reductase alpha chain